MFYIIFFLSFSDTHWNTLKVINKNNLFLEMLEALQTTHKKTKKNKDILAGECNKTCEVSNYFIISIYIFKIMFEKFNITLNLII